MFRYPLLRSPQSSWTLHHPIRLQSWRRGGQGGSRAAVPRWRKCTQGLCNGRDISEWAVTCSAPSPLWGSARRSLTRSHEVGATHGLNRRLHAAPAESRQKGLVVGSRSPAPRHKGVIMDGAAVVSTAWESVQIDSIFLAKSARKFLRLTYSCKYRKVNVSICLGKTLNTPSMDQWKPICVYVCD